MAAYLFNPTISRHFHSLLPHKFSVMCTVAHLHLGNQYNESRLEPIMVQIVLFPGLFLHLSPSAFAEQVLFGFTDEVQGGQSLDFISRAWSIDTR